MHFNLINHQEFKKIRKAYSLIEVVIAVSLTALIGLMILNVMINSLSQYKTFKSQGQVLTRGTQIISEINTDLFEAKSVVNSFSAANKIKDVDGIFTDGDTGNWVNFKYSGALTNWNIKQKGYNGYNYVSLTGSGFGDSGMRLYIPNLKANTNYIVTTQVAIPTAGTNFGSGIVYVTSSDNNTGIKSFNPSSKNAIPWTKIGGTFNTGSNTAINIRINRGDFGEIDVTDIQLQEEGGSSQLYFMAQSDDNSYQYPVSYSLSNGIFKKQIQLKDYKTLIEANDPNIKMTAFSVDMSNYIYNATDKTNRMVKIRFTLENKDKLYSKTFEMEAYIKCDE